MDEQRFDRLTRALAGRLSRRQVLSAAGIATSWISLRRPLALAQDDRDDGSDIEITGVDDLPPCSMCLQGQRCIAGECCPEKQACGDICCPPETIGCSAPVGPGGGPGAVSCLCPDGLIYDRYENACRPCGGFSTPCRGDEDCCTGVCRDGACTCIGDGEACETSDQCCNGACDRGVCACVPSGGACSSASDCCGVACVDGACSACTTPGGACRSNDDCCGTKYHGGKAPFEEWGKCVDGVCRCCYSGSTFNCGPNYREFESPAADLCCDYPLVGYGCCTDQSDCSTCIVGCCTDGVDCDIARGIFPGCPQGATWPGVYPPDQFACAT